MYIRQLILFMMILLLAGCRTGNRHAEGIPPNEVVPSARQVAYQQMEFVGFIHFSINTFTGKEWGYGDEPPLLFNPAQLDARQWARVARDAGMKELILTAKHHDGFCLWPSQYTDHCIRNSPYKDGNGDVVREFVDACREYGLKAGLYLSPWDRNHPDYGKPEYIDYYRKQLIELLTQYGEINEIWFDGANGGSGWYGGANEIRKIDAATYYDWDSTFRLVKKLQPDILIFSDAGPEIRWIGNEYGHAGDPFWSTIERDKLIIGRSDQDYLNSGDPEGSDWIIGQCDVSIRPGWFYHEEEDSLVKTPEQLLDIYFKSVGRNAVLLLNIPPDRRGLIHEQDIASLKAFRELLDRTFATDLAKGVSVSASNTRGGKESFSPQGLVDNDPGTFWATDNTVRQALITLGPGREMTFDIIMIREPVEYGQRISRFRLETWTEEGWMPVFEGTTIGFKRLIRIPPLTTSQFRLLILEANNTPTLSRIGLFRSAGH
jgi:alpha-L-fucosidase